MRTFTIATIALSAFVASALPAHASSATHCAPATPAAVEGLFTQFNSAWATKDPAKVTNLFTKDAVLLATVSNKPRTTPAAINDYFVGFLKNSPVGTIQTSTVSIGCNIATRLGTWDVALTNPETKAVTVVKARYSFIYKYEDGAWKIYHLHSSMMPEPTS
ncbi:SgcJ/EcaC family oxidoreductase [Candidatus Phycosocius spiralis]|uniref:Cag pathogenicity island protein Cag5 n=1 Tax=Candidatus Phycosocius spiralis TaxID=2815099 RepID=A0ABQ4PXU0_9PROT|nr:SgcJ/EcaC family oxidoreductase [Candidatus Phycosocius spiralis]GIU67847.1 cag pathogenicity island protein Cag5 [Candidatus Phycosocius spiralis]